MFLLGILVGIINENSPSLPYLIPGLFIFIATEILDIICIYRFYHLKQTKLPADSITNDHDNVDYHTPNGQYSDSLEMDSEPYGPTVTTQYNAQVIFIRFGYKYCNFNVSLYLVIIIMEPYSHWCEASCQHFYRYIVSNFTHLFPLSIIYSVHTYCVLFWHSHCISLVIFLLVHPRYTWSRFTSDGIMYICK